MDLDDENEVQLSVSGVAVAFVDKVGVELYSILLIDILIQKEKDDDSKKDASQGNS